MATDLDDADVLDLLLAACHLDGEGVPHGVHKVGDVDVVEPALLREVGGDGAQRHRDRLVAAVGTVLADVLVDRGLDQVVQHVLRHQPAGVAPLRRVHREQVVLHVADLRGLEQSVPMAGPRGSKGPRVRAGWGRGRGGGGARARV